MSSFEAKPGITVQPPLTRRGKGPPLITVVEEGLPTQGHERTLDPPPLQKWAEEGYTVASVTLAQTHTDLERDQFGELVRGALEILKEERCCVPGVDAGVGVLTYTLSPHPDLLTHIEAIHPFRAIVSYGHLHQPGGAPYLTHIAGDAEVKYSFPEENKKLRRYHYPGVRGSSFILPASDDYDGGAAAIAHTRTLGFIKPLLGGPYFDLETAWDEHTGFEFGERSVEKTMATMVQQPYVNHVPTMTGGVGRERLSNFYRDHFIFGNPDDTALEPVSRTVGVDRVVDEFVFRCTHDKTMDWLIPGIPPTQRPLAVPMTAIVNIRGDRLSHEHIAWDQGTVLRQLGLLPEYLPFSHPLPDGRTPAPGKRFEFRVPVAGAETARKLVDEGAAVSNGMFGFGIREVDDV